MYELSLFSGAGGGILGGKLLGWKCIGAVEIEGYCRGVLAQRQNDGCLDPFPIWDDICTFRSDNPECSGYFNFLRSIRGELVVTGGFPCQDISAAGNGAGIDGARSGLWREMARVVREVVPRYVLVENSPMLVSRGLGRVLGDLASMGYDARWGVFSCAEVGGVHLRERIFIYGANHREERVQGIVPKTVHRFSGFPWGEDVRGIEDMRNRPDLPPSLVRRSGDGMACYMDRIAAIGNGQVPSVVRLAWEALSGRGWTTQDGRRSRKE